MRKMKIQQQICMNDLKTFASWVEMKETSFSFRAAKFFIIKDTFKVRNTQRVFLSLSLVLLSTVNG